MRRLSVVVLTVVAAALPAGSAHAFAMDVTDLPELQVATVVATTAAAEASASAPAGTTITYRFDEPVDATSPDPSTFVVYDEQGDRSVAAEATVEGDTVTALFPDIDTAAKERALTLAAARAGAVQDSAGETSPTGSVGITRWTSRKASGPQDCLRLRRVKDLRHAHGNTTVKVVFACAGGWVGYDPRGFQLQMVDGRSIRAVRARSAGSLPMSATLVFPGLRYSSHIARLTVAAGAVHNTHDDGTEYEVTDFNALQALAISHLGNTVRPDLVSVKLLPSSSADRPDHALFLFDQPVSDPLARRFRLNDVAKGTGAVVPPRHPRQVRVTFAPGAAKAATFATVRGGAVPTGRADEVGAPNVLWYSDLTRGYTAGPDVEAISYRYDDAPDGSVLTATIGFDGTLTDGVAADAFHLYDKPGTRYEAQQCSLTNQTDLSTQVTCSFPTAPSGSTHAYLATVVADAVHDDAGRGNPEASRWAYPG